MLLPGDRIGQLIILNPEFITFMIRPSILKVIVISFVNVVPGSSKKLTVSSKFGATTFCIMTFTLIDLIVILSEMTLGISVNCHYAE
jgi:hypothetical protein